MTKKALEQAERKISELESILNTKEEMLEDLLSTIKEKDSKMRREEQEHVQIQNELIIKNVKLLQEREENLKIISQRSKQIEEYKYYVTELSVKMDKLKNEILVNEDKLIDENEMLKARVKQENLNFTLMLDTLKTEKECLSHENNKLKRKIEEKNVRMTETLKQEGDKFVALNEEKNELEKSVSKINSSYKEILQDNSRLEEGLRKSENNIKKIKEKMKIQSVNYQEDTRLWEEKLLLLQKDNCHKSHKINFMLEKIESDCVKWNRIENDLKDEINNLNILILESKSQIKVKDEAISKMRYVMLFLLFLCRQV